MFTTAHARTNAHTHPTLTLLLSHTYNTTRTRTHTHTRTYTYTHTRAHTNTNTHKHTRARTHTHTYLHTRTHSHTHTHLHPARCLDILRKAPVEKVSCLSLSTHCHISKSGRYRLTARSKLIGWKCATPPTYVTLLVSRYPFCSTIPAHLQQQLLSGEPKAGSGRVSRTDVDLPMRTS
jgi:hypothetical protein